MNLQGLNQIIESPTGKATQSFLEKITGSLPDLLYNSTVAINFRLRALTNQIDALEKVRVICEAKKINIRQVKLNVLLPYLEGVAVEEEPELQNLWSKLMVNYLNADKVMTSHVYPEILKQLSTQDIRILNKAAEEGKVLTGILSSIQGETITEYTIANLDRLRLVVKDAPFDSGPTYIFHQPNTIEIRNDITYNLTPFGFNFLQAIGYEPPIH